jgi:hypothetical protein
MTEDTLNGYEQDALIDWYESDWPTTSAAVATLYAAVEAIVAARTAALARDRDALAAKITRVEALAGEWLDAGVTECGNYPNGTRNGTTRDV